MQKLRIAELTREIDGKKRKVEILHNDTEINGKRMKKDISLDVEMANDETSTCTGTNVIASIPDLTNSIWDRIILQDESMSKYQNNMFETI